MKQLGDSLFIDPSRVFAVRVQPWYDQMGMLGGFKRADIYLDAADQPPDQAIALTVEAHLSQLMSEIENPAGGFQLTVVPAAKQDISWLWAVSESKLFKASVKRNKDSDLEAVTLSFQLRLPDRLATLTVDDVSEAKAIYSFLARKV